MALTWENCDFHIFEPGLRFQDLTGGARWQAWMEMELHMDAAAEENRFLLIQGQPGSGRKTLLRALAADLLEKGYSGHELFVREDASSRKTLEQLYEELTVGKRVLLLYGLDSFGNSSSAADLAFCLEQLSREARDLVVLTAAAKPGDLTDRLQGLFRVLPMISATDAEKVNFLRNQLKPFRMEKSAGPSVKELLKDKTFRQLQEAAALARRLRLLEELQKDEEPQEVQKLIQAGKVMISGKCLEQALEELPSGSREQDAHMQQPALQGISILADLAEKLQNVTAGGQSAGLQKAAAQAAQSAETGLDKLANSQDISVQMQRAEQLMMAKDPTEAELDAMLKARGQYQEKRFVNVL